MQSTTVRTVLWCPIKSPGAEQCALRRLANGFRLEGHVVGAAEGLPHHVHYIVDCDAAWRTRVVTVDQSLGPTRRTLRLDVEHSRRWRSGGAEYRELEGLVDVDLGVTPATNTLPIRRLGLAVGEWADVTAAWVRFPSLTVSPLAQRYERIAPAVYRYTSDGGRFTALLEVDDLGLVVRYEGGWERTAAG
jgi:hypothetical protein